MGFFHASTEKRKAINKFAVIETQDGTQVYKEEEIAATIEQYFCKLFTPSVMDRQYMEEIVSEAYRRTVFYPKHTSIPSLCAL